MTTTTLPSSTGKQKFLPRVALLATSEGKSKREAKKAEREAENGVKANSTNTKNEQTIVARRPLYATLPVAPSEINWSRDLGIALFMAETPMENWSWRPLPSNGEVFPQKTSTPRSSLLNSSRNVPNKPIQQASPSTPKHIPAAMFLEGPEHCIILNQSAEGKAVVSGTKPTTTISLCLKTFLKETFPRIKPRSYGDFIRQVLVQGVQRFHSAKNLAEYYLSSETFFTKPCSHPLDLCSWDSVKSSFVFGSADFICNACGTGPLMIHSLSGYDDVENVVQAVDSNWCRRNEAELRSRKLLPDKLVYK